MLAGRRGRGLRQPRQAAAAAALRQHSRRWRRGQGRAGRLRGPHAGRTGEDLLRAGREPRRRTQQVRSSSSCAPARWKCCCWAIAWIRGSRASWHEFEGKAFQDAARGDLDLSKLGTTSDDAGAAATETDDHKALFERTTKALGDAVAGVKASRRLTESPACLTRTEDDMSEQMRRVLAAAGRGDLPPAKPGAGTEHGASARYSGWPGSRVRTSASWPSCFTTRRSSPSRGSWPIPASTPGG